LAIFFDYLKQRNEKFEIWNNTHTKET